MASLIQEIVKQAQFSFSKTYREGSVTHSLSELLRLINRLQASDLNINLDTEEADCNGENAAKGSEPVTITCIKDDKYFSMAVCVLKNGSKIPLHDHPQMHGIIKVILGTVKMTSYSPALSNDTEIPEEIRRMNHPKDSLVPVELHKSQNVTNKNEPVLVTPTLGNYHEMCAVEGPAVIFEVYAPPYNTNKPNIHYYTVLESKDSNIQCKIWLAEIPVDSEFWCDVCKYTGPSVSF